MLRRLRFAAFALLAAAVTSSALATTQTNVLQNINLQLTIYQPGATNATKVTDQVTRYTTKNFISDVGLVTASNAAYFGSGAKLVLSSVYSNLATTTGSYSPVLSTNLPVPTNDAGIMLIGGGLIGFLTQTFTIIGNELINNTTGDVIPMNGDIVAVNIDTNEYVTINTNVGFRTTLTPSTNSFGQVTNIAVLEQNAPVGFVFTNISNSIDILYNGVNNTLFPVANYLSFTTNPPQIVVETGSGLNTTNATLASQTGFSIQSLNINYGGAINLVLNLSGFVRQTLKVDTLAPAHGATPKIVEDIFGANSSWNVIGSGYAGGIFTTDTANISTNEIPVGSLGYLSNASPVVVEGTVSISFFKNLAQ